MANQEEFRRNQQFSYPGIFVAALEKKNFLLPYIPAEKRTSTSGTNIQFYRYISLLGLRWISSIQFTRSTYLIIFLSLYGQGVRICYFESYIVGGLCIFVLFVRLTGNGVPILVGSDSLFSLTNFILIIIYRLILIQNVCLKYSYQI